MSGVRQSAACTLERALLTCWQCGAGAHLREAPSRRGDGQRCYGRDRAGDGLLDGIHVGADAPVRDITVHSDVVGRGVIDVSEELMYDVSDLANNPYLGLAQLHLHNSRALRRARATYP